MTRENEARTLDVNELVKAVQQGHASVCDTAAELEIEAEYAEDGLRIGRGHRGCHLILVAPRHLLA
jgi:hypothetical protein